MEEINQTKKAYDYAVYLLGLHLRTEGELINKLKIKSYKLKIIEEVIKQLKDHRYIDDARYAEIYVDNLKKYKNFGFYGIKKKLMEKRLPSEIITRVLADGLPVEEELKIAKRFMQKSPPVKDPDRSVGAKEGWPRSGRLARRSLGEVGSGIDNKARQKIFRQLASRGFRSDVIAKLVF